MKIAMLVALVGLPFTAVAAPNGPDVTHLNTSTTDTSGFANHGVVGSVRAYTLGSYTCNISTDTGGFVIMDIPNSFAGWVLLGTSTAGGPLRPNMLNLANGVWHHIALTIPATLVGAGNGSKFVLEQWNGSTNAAGNAYFDNISVSTNPVPEPSSLLLAGLGVLLIAAGRQRRTHV